MQNVLPVTAVASALGFSSPRIQQPACHNSRQIKFVHAAQQVEEGSLFDGGVVLLDSICLRLLYLGRFRFGIAGE
jgi:hypothetical protein